MSFLNMTVLALVQGLTEFLPVSSSGHLVVFQSLMNLKEPGVTLEVMLHSGSLIAILIVFRNDVLGIIKGFLGWTGIIDKHPYEKLFWMVLLASIPAGVIGMAFYSTITGFFGSAVFAYVFLIFNGIYLTVNRFAEGGAIKLPETGPVRAAVIGLSQVVSMLPGISRSGTTITTGILLKMDREAAARFSFLMSIPAIAGATLYEARGISSLDTSISLLAAGIIISFAASYIAIKILLKVILAKKLHYFGYYCFLAGLAGLLFLR